MTPVVFFSVFFFLFQLPQWWIYGGIVAEVTTLSSMASITETSSGLVYYRGQCQFSFPVPSRAGNVTYYVQGTPGYKKMEINQTLFIGEL